MDGLGYEWIRLMHQLILVDVEHIAGKEKPGPKKKKKKWSALILIAHLGCKTIDYLLACANIKKNWFG